MSLKLKVPPPIVALATAATMWLIARQTRNFAIAIPASRLIAGALALLGVLIAVAGVRSFRKAQTTINPLKPESATSLVDFGIYRLTRNPMYIGMLLVLIAFAVLLSNPLALLGLAAFVVYMNRFQIAPEEAALTMLFGQKYTNYKTRVRRWI